jgi:purine-binding chemotaxis protein CheW
MINDSIEHQEYLTFILNQEEYGVDILRVQEIRVWSPVTELPNTPHYVKGIINLRGAVVPIIDLRERFNQQSSDYSATTVVIILRNEKPAEFNPNHDDMMIGLVVDAVSEVYKLSTQTMQPSPKFGSKVDTRFIKGIATVDEKLIILLNTDALLDREQLFDAVEKVELNS